MSRVNAEAVKSTRNAVRRQFYLLFILSYFFNKTKYEKTKTMKSKETSG